MLYHLRLQMGRRASFVRISIEPGVLFLSSWVITDGLGGAVYIWIRKLLEFYHPVAGPLRSAEYVVDLYILYMAFSQSFLSGTCTFMDVCIGPNIEWCRSSEVTMKTDKIHNPDRMDDFGGENDTKTKQK